MSRSTFAAAHGRKSIVIAALVLGFVAAVAGGSIALATEASHPRKPAPASSATTHWPTNAKGQTYGSAAYATSPENEPDLILAGATNGETGYVLRTDLEEPAPKSPEEALARQAAEAGKSRVIPVYKSDGVTQIGVFVIQPGSGVEVGAGSGDELPAGPTRSEP